MVNKRLFIPLLILLSCSFCIKASAQHDTLHITARVMKVEKIKYYRVIRIQEENGNRKLTILSPSKEKQKMPGGKMDNSFVKEGQIYAFDLVAVDRIKIQKDKYLLLSLKKFYAGNVLLLEAGEIPYTATDMQGQFIRKK